MQNKGFVIVITSALAIICAFYLSFSFVTNRYEKKAKAMGDVAGMAYLDSMSNEKVWFGYTLKEAQAQQIGLGLDLKGGMNVILKLIASSIPTVAWPLSSVRVTFATRLPQSLRMQT